MCTYVHVCTYVHKDRMNWSDVMCDTMQSAVYNLLQDLRT